MNNIAFIAFTLKSLAIAITNLSASYPATVVAPVTPEQVTGLVSDVQMIQKQNMLGDEGAAQYPITMADPRGVVIPTTTADASATFPLILPIKATYSVFDAPKY